MGQIEREPLLTDQGTGALSAGAEPDGIQPDARRKEPLSPRLPWLGTRQAVDRRSGTRVQTGPGPSETTVAPEQRPHGRSLVVSGLRKTLETVSLHRILERTSRTEKPREKTTVFDEILIDLPRTGGQELCLQDGRHASVTVFQREPGERRWKPVNGPGVDRVIYSEAHEALLIAGQNESTPARVAHWDPSVAETYLAGPKPDLSRHALLTTRPPLGQEEVDFAKVVDLQEPGGDHRHVLQIWGQVVNTDDEGSLVDLKARQQSILVGCISIDLGWLSPEKLELLAAQLGVKLDTNVVDAGLGPDGVREALSRAFHPDRVPKQVEKQLYLGFWLFGTPPRQADGGLTREQSLAGSFLVERGPAEAA